MDDVMQERYGTARPRRRLLLRVATTVLAVVFLAWLGWAAWFHSDEPIKAELAAFDVVDDHQVRVRLDTRLRDGVAGSCLIRATARDHTIVGELNVTVAQMRAAQGGWITFTTLSRATTVEKVSCTER